MNLSYRSFLLFFYLISFHSFAEFSLRSNEKVIKSEFSIRSLTSKLEKKDFENLLRDFVLNSRPSRLIGSQGSHSAKEWLEAKIKKIDSSHTGELQIQEFSLDHLRIKKFYSDELKKSSENKAFRISPEAEKFSLYTKELFSFVEKKTLQEKNFI